MTWGFITMFHQTIIWEVICFGASTWVSISHRFRRVANFQGGFRVTYIPPQKKVDIRVHKKMVG